MTAPLAPQSRATSADGTSSEPANDAAFLVEQAISAATSASGWDPYEVWRTRVLAAQPPESKKR
jgi:hypothetical protein